MTNKQCFKCGEMKGLSAFYRHPRMADGHVNKCKECNKRDVRDNRKDKIDYYRAYDIERKRRTNNRDKNYRAEFPKKYKAHSLVASAIKTGKIANPGVCESCKSSDHSLHAHHDDYSRPLDVRWLCPPCHWKWHDTHGEAHNGR